MKTITLQIDNQTAKALEALGLTRGVEAEALASAMLINSTAQSVGQGPGEIIECYLWGAREFEAGRSTMDWEDERLAIPRLKELRHAVKRIKQKMRKEAA